MRTEIKSAAAVKRNMSTSSSASVLGGNNVSSRSTGAAESRKKRAKTEKAVIAVTDESSSTSSSQAARVDSSLVSYEDDAHLHNLQHYVYVGTAAAAEPATAATTATQAQVISTAQGHGQGAMVEAVTAAEFVQSSTGTSTCPVDEVVIEAQPQPQPFSDDESMYLADLFGKYERDRPSHEDDLWSILSLNRETTLEDFLLDL